MAIEEYVQILRQGVAAWNDWRKNNPKLLDPNLSGADLRGVDLRAARLSGANLRGAKLSEADLSAVDLSDIHLTKANLSGANLSAANLTRTKLCGASLTGANLSTADLSGADLSGADLIGARLGGADLSGANLCETNLSAAQLIHTNLEDATLTGSSVYGTSVWDIKVNNGTRQENLIITKVSEPVVTVDNIKVAQFIYLLLNNKEIRDVIDTITSKAVLILGRFSEDRKPVLDAIRDELRKPEHNYLPIVFDFEPSVNQTTIETIKTLANMARFVIADLTDARSVLMELMAIVPLLPSVAVRLLIKKSEHEHGMLDYIRRYNSVVGNTYQYENLQEVITSIKDNIILPAETKVRELRGSATRTPG